jgi:hypothetical protein
MNWRLPQMSDPHYPAGVSDSDPHFDLPNADGSRIGRRKPPAPPRTTMVYCSPCMKHWEAPAREDYWNARVELCPRHMAGEVEETRK